MNHLTEVNILEAASRKNTSKLLVFYSFIHIAEYFHTLNFIRTDQTEEEKLKNN